MQILHEDNHLIAIFKPAGFLSQGDKTGDATIFNEVKKYLKEKYKKPGNVYLGLLHRLDRPVSGIMLFAKTSKGASRLSEQFRNHAVEKTYHAIVLGKPQKSRGVLTNLLGKYTKSMKAREFPDGKEVKLFYEVVKTGKPFGATQAFGSESQARGGDYSLLRIIIDTGKFHQIRAQLSFAGYPILGDIKYGGEKWDDSKSIALCATELSFNAATEDKKIKISIKIPESWNKYLAGVIHSEGLDFSV